MKTATTLIILAFCLSVANTSSAQEYVPFPNSNAKWKVSHTDYGGSGQPQYYGYKLDGDTNINGHDYNRVLSFGGNVVGAIREDTTKRIYFIKKNADEEYLLYDFNLNVGDTIKYRPITSCCGDSISIIHSIDSIKIGDTYRRMFDLRDTLGVNGVALIEGIGSTSGLLECSMCNEWQNTLRCFMQNDITLFPDTSVDCIALSYGDDKELTTCGFSVYPNPFNNRLSVEVSDFSFCKHENITIRIFSIYGKQLFFNSYSYSDIHTLNLDFLPSNIYLLEIKTNNTIVNYKIIKL